MTVEKYDTRFQSMIQFMLWAQANPREAFSRFQEGMKPSIRRIVSTFRFERYSDMLNLACLLEREEEMYNQIREQSRGTKSGGPTVKKQKLSTEGITYTTKGV
ncbi:hypothetical protein ACLOJK_041419 [Asimina triloba]